MLRFADPVHGPVALVEAWKDFTLCDEETENFDPESSYMPELVTSDSDPLEFHRLIYAIDWDEQDQGDDANRVPCSLDPGEGSARSSSGLPPRLREPEIITSTESPFAPP